MRESRKKIFAAVMYGVMLIFIQLPWFVVDGKRYTVYGLYSYAKTLDGVNMGVFRLEIFVLILFMIFSVLHLLTRFMNKRWHLDIMCLLLTLIHVQLLGGELISATGSVYVQLYPTILITLCLAEFVIPKMADAIQDGKEEAKASVQRDRDYKVEKKKRLRFAGRYTELFYQMVWKNFSYYWRDYVLFILCGVMIGTFSFVGLGSYEMLTEVHSKDAVVIQTGLGSILLDALFPIGICATILMVYVLIFYVKKRFLSYSLFFQLGSRKKTVYRMLAIEIVLSLVISLGVGCLLGNGIILLLRGVITDVLGEAALLSAVTWKTYVKMLGVVTGIYLIALMATRDIALDLNVVSVSAKNAQSESLPRKGLFPLIVLGIILMSMFAFSYRFIHNFENINLLLLYFVGVFLVLRFGMAMYLNKAKKGGRYLERLMSRNQLYHKSKTTTWYVLAISLISTCAVFYFTMQTVSSMLVEDVDTLYPYDFMCIVDEEDDPFFEELQKKYDIEMDTYPMVRVSSSDGTVMMEQSNEHSPQGQHIGVSETTYHALNKALDAGYKAQPLNLDEDGKQIYIVHQQSSGTRAQPVDWQLPRTRPYLHIGPVCPDYIRFVQRGIIDFPARNIIGDEFGSLTGCFRQGMQENIIVFSDSYFKEAQEFWKYTNPYNGEVVLEKDSPKLNGIEVRQGPNKLVLIHAKATDLNAIEAEMQSLKQMPNHVYEASYNSEISCYYSKQTAVADYKTERAMRMIVNGLVIAMFMIAYVLLMSVKVYAEMEEKIKRAEFLKTMGMPRKERIQMLKGELHLFFWMPVFITAATTICFMVSVFHARMYTSLLIKECLSRAVWIWAIYFLVEIVTIGLLSILVVRKVEGKNE